MRSLKTGGFPVLLMAAATVLAACGGSSHAGSASVEPGLTPDASTIRGPASGPVYRVLHDFGHGDDGGLPMAGLVAMNGKFYGSTSATLDSNDPGTVFEYDPADGHYRTVYRFKLPPDGARPETNLIAVNNALYGTTPEGGANYDGTVFEVDPNGSERVLHSFGGSKDDGYHPAAPLLEFHGKLYGTTASGGRDGNGVVFEIDTAGHERVIHSFSGANGSGPAAGLIAHDGVMYGTTAGGGKYGKGTVFSVDESGNEILLYSFQGPDRRDGWSPRASGPGFAVIAGVLYGSTYAGGARIDSRGTLFETGPRRPYHVMRDFTGTEKGFHPVGLVAAGDLLYGMTKDGGTGTNRFGHIGAGTIFRITPSGRFGVLHNFNNPEGSEPESELLSFDNRLYGTATSGGSGEAGVLFELQP